MIGTIATLVAATASLVAIAIGIDQMMSGARLRGLEQVLRDARGSVDGAHAEVLRSVQIATLGRLLARQAVPATQFAEGALVVCLSWSQVTVTSLAFEMGGRTGLPLFLVSGAIAVFFGGIGCAEIAFMAAERVRVAARFQAGDSPLVALADRRTMLATCLRTVAWPAYALSLAVTLALTIGATLIAGSGSLASNLVPVLFLAFIVPSVPSLGAMALNGMLLAHRDEARRSRWRPQPTWTWVHPNPLAWLGSREPGLSGPVPAPTSTSEPEKKRKRTPKG